MPGAVTTTAREPAGLQSQPAPLVASGSAALTPATAPWLTSPAAGAAGELRIDAWSDAAPRGLRGLGRGGRSGSRQAHAAVAPGPGLARRCRARSAVTIR